MSAISDISGSGVAVSIDPVATVTSTSTGSGIDIRDFIGNIEIILDCSQGTGTSPTFDGKIQSSADDSTYADVSGATFDQVTDSAASYQSLVINADATARYIRFVGTVAGTTPSFSYSVTGYGTKYNS